MKKNYFKVPTKIRVKEKAITTDSVYIATAVRLQKPEIIAGKYADKGVTYQDGEVALVKDYMPSVNAGHYSERNHKGRVIVQKNLPKAKKNFSFETPNFGDWNKGSHTVSWDKDVYQRETENPKKIVFNYEILEEKDDEVVVGIRVEKELIKAEPNYEYDLLYCINLLQENWGKVDLIARGKPLRELVAYNQLDWEILPKGWWSDPVRVQRLAKQMGTARAQQLLETRLKHVSSLDPIESYEGRSYLGGRVYYVFVFPSVVIAESPMWGNAAYVLSGELAANWKDVLSGTKRGALTIGAKRVMHTGSWELTIGKIVGR